MTRPNPTPTYRFAMMAVSALVVFADLHAQDGADNRMTFALAGDAIITQRLSPFDEPEFMSMIEVIRNADLAFVNLEVLFHTYTEGYPAAHSGGTWMAAHPRIAHELTWAGFDMVSLANNHTMDWAAGGMRATITALEAADLTYAGAGENLGMARAPGYRESRGGRVALISVASTFSDEDRAGAQRSDIRGRPGLSPIRYNVTYHVSQESIDKLEQVGDELGRGFNQTGDRVRFLGDTFVASSARGRKTTVHRGDLAEVVAVVADARRQADWVIVTSHSHESAESRHVPAEFIEEFAHAVIDAGADMWVGHGPHVLRGIEVYGGKPIFYSLANFIFQNETVELLPAEFYTNQGLDANAPPADGFDRRNERARGGGFPSDPVFWESVVASPTFVDGQLDHILLHPITLGHGLARAQRGRPVLADAATGRKIIEHIAELSEPFGVTIVYDRNRNVGVIR